MSGHPSIRRQLIWRLSVLFLLSLILSSAIFLYEAWINRINNLDQVLRGAAKTLGTTVEFGAAGQLRIPDSASATLAPVEIPSLRYAVVESGTGITADGSSASLLQELASGIALRDGGFDFRDSSGRQDRGYAITEMKQGRALRVIVSSATLSFGDTIAWMQDETLSELVPVLAPLFIGVLLVAPFTIRRSLRPIDRLSAEAALIEPSRTDIRLEEAGVPVEILPLVHTINTALGRIDEGFAQQRRFTTNAAHELRTPLAILRARIDGLDEGATKTGLIKDVERMARLVSQLLIAGRLEMQPPPLQARVDLAEIARETVDRLAVLHTARDHELRLRLPAHPVTIRGDAESLGDALRNLIDNALAHSPPGRPVEIAVAADGSVEVRDHGSGIPSEDRERIFERFWRARKSGGDGAGIGLSIVRATVQYHQGTINVAENPGGGSIFRMAFPLVTSPSASAIGMA